MTEFDVDCPRCKRIKESITARQQSSNEQNTQNAPSAPPAPPTMQAPPAPPAPPETNFNYSVTQNWSIGPSSTGTGTGNSKKSNVAAGLLAIFLGMLGIHKFYNGSYGWGIIYILAPAILSAILPCFGVIAISLVCLIEAVIYFVDKQKYDRNYNQIPPSPWKW